MSERTAPDAALEVEGLALRAGSRRLVDDLAFRLEAGDHLVVLGRNGCGKSTLLAALAGLDAPAAGSVRRPPGPPGMLFQDGALWPHMSVADHLAFADVRGDPAWRGQLLEHFDLTALAGHRPEQLSGGERQRLGLARAFAGRPRWVLLDEPMAHLDPPQVAAMREVLPQLLEELDATTLVVTHDPEEVLLFGARVLGLSGRGPWWLGPARAALDAPPTAWLAAFSDRGTLLEGVADGTGRAEMGLGLGLDGLPPGRRAHAFLAEAALRLRPAPGGDALAGTFVAPDRRGGSWIRVDGRLLRCADPPGVLRAGDRVGVLVVGRLRPLDEAPA